MAKALVTFRRKIKGEYKEMELGLSGTLVTCEDLLKQKFWAADCPGYLIKLPKRAYECVKQIEETDKETWKEYAENLKEGEGLTVNVDAGVITCKVILHDEKRARELRHGDRNIILEATKMELKNIKPFRKPGEALTVELYDIKRRYQLTLEILGSVK